MQAAGWSRSGVVAVSLVALTWLVTCSSSSAADGASCGKGSDCSSGSCVAGACLGKDCTCEGSDCRSRGSCDEGWLCTRGSTGDSFPVPRCRQQCGGAFPACSAAEHCVDGVCRPGASPFSLAFTNIPRPRPCGSRVPCEYKVKPTEGTTVDQYTWAFGDAPPVTTTEPTTSFTYPRGGTFVVRVGAHATTGAEAHAETTESVCDGVMGSQCDPNGAPCCQGSCSAQLTCR